MATIRLSEKVGMDGLLESKVFQDDVIHGPAVLGLLNDVEMVDCHFYANVKGMFIEVPDGQPAVGVIVVRDVAFQGCHFHNVSFIGTKDTIADLKTKLGL